MTGKELFDELTRLQSTGVDLASLEIEVTHYDYDSYSPCQHRRCIESKSYPESISLSSSGTMLVLD